MTSEISEEICNHVYPCTCGLLTITEQRDRFQNALITIRGRYVKRLPGVEKAKCTLCGAEAGTPHGEDFNCGIADRALTSVDSETTDPQRPEGE